MVSIVTIMNLANVNGVKEELIMAREKLWVCEHCLWAIESREGNQATLRHYVDEEDENESKCEWCEEHGFYVLYELI